MKRTGTPTRTGPLAPLAVVGICALFASVSDAAAETTFDRIKSSGVLRVCGVDGLLPYSSSDPNVPGFEVEIARKMAAELGVEAEYVWVTWDALIPALTSERCDAIINGMFITDERDEIIDFSDPYYGSGETILVRKDNDSVHDLDDLEGKTVGVLAGSVTVGHLEEKSIGNLEVYPSQNTIILELNNGRIDAAFLEAPSAAWTIKNDPTLNIKVVESYVPEERWNAAVGLREEDDELEQALNRVIEDLHEKGAVREILNKYGVPYFPIMAG